MAIDEQYFKTRLLDWRDQLAAQAGQDGSAIELDQSRVGRLSRMDAMQGHELSLEARRRSLADIKRIDAALLKIEQGEFGECEECGEPIAPARLEIDPAAKLCIDCARALET